MRRPTACSVCRSRRRKCHIPSDGGRCAYCLAQNLNCSRAGSSVKASLLPESPGHSLGHGPSPASSGSSNDPLSPVLGGGDRALKVELVELYFKYIHDQFHSLFHRPSFMLDLEQGTAPPVIVYAMMALSARFSENAVFSDIPPTERGEPFARKSSALLNLRDISLTTIQACVLLGVVSISDGEAVAESVFYSAACRIANFLDLPTLASDDPITREVYLRVYWSLCMIDVWSSDGINLPRQMNRRDNVPFPMDEAAFLRMHRNSDGYADPADSKATPSRDDPSREDSLLAQMIKLNSILLEVYNGIKVFTSDHTGASTCETVDAVSRKLDAWERALPPHMRDTPENLHAFAAQGLGRFFVAIYLGYYHYGQLLFYQYLDEEQRLSSAAAAANTRSSSSSPTAMSDGTATPPMKTNSSTSIASLIAPAPPSTDPALIHARAARCKSFAMSLSRLVDTALATAGCDVRYNMVGHITVVASSVQIHTLLSSPDEGEIAAARAQLARNFATLVALRRYWRALEVCFARLRTFHGLCRASGPERSYRMDRWMVRFLTEFGRPVDREWEGGEWNGGRGGWDSEGEGVVMDITT